jgi:SAM-dependent methyltransferase
MQLIAPHPETADPQIIQSFIQVTYRGLLGREPDAVGLNQYTARFLSKETTTPQFLMEILDSEEFAQKPLPQDFGESLDWLLRAHLEVSPEDEASKIERYVRLAFQTILRREPTVDDLAYYEPLFRNQTLPAREFLQALARSEEREDLGLYQAFMEGLHRSRVQIVKQLPKAQVIVDLGGASGDSEGALLQMGYPYQFQKLSIIDMPLELRHEIYGDLGYYPDIVHSKQGPIEWIYSSMTDLARFARGTVDLVFSGESIEHITRDEGTVVCREVFRILKPGGFFCLDTPNRAITRITSPNELIHPEHKHEYTHAELSGLLRATGFVIREAKGICWATDKAAAGFFSPDRQALECTRELRNHEGVYDDIENCFCLYYKCQKPA